MPKYQIFSRNNVINFYKKIKFSKFKNLTKERCLEIDELVNNWWAYFHNNAVSFLVVSYLVADKLTTSAKTMGLNNGDETFYFYIKMLDPSLVMLEIYETANTTEELQELVTKNFPIFDHYLLKLEQLLNEQLQIYKPEDLWARDVIRR